MNLTVEDLALMHDDLEIAIVSGVYDDEREKDVLTRQLKLKRVLHQYQAQQQAKAESETEHEDKEQ